MDGLEDIVKSIQGIKDSKQAVIELIKYMSETGVLDAEYRLSSDKISHYIRFNGNGLEDKYGLTNNPKKEKIFKINLNPDDPRIYASYDAGTSENKTKDYYVKDKATEVKIYNALKDLIIHSVEVQASLVNNKAYTDFLNAVKNKGEEEIDEMIKSLEAKIKTSNKE